MQWRSIVISQRPWEGTSLGDLDHDGDLDIAINSYWYQNPAPGGDPRFVAWTERVIDTNWPVSVGVHIRDMNADGRNDVLFAPSAGFAGRLSWYETANPLGGTWTEHVIDPSTECVHTFKTADIDLDGDIDVVTGEGHYCNDPDNISVYLNQGSALSWVEQIVATSGIHNLRIADIGSDGDIDIVGSNAHDVVNPHGSPLEMWENLLRVSAGGPPIILVNPQSQTAIVGDFASFNLIASGNQLGYQWQRNAQNISGATSSSYTTGPLSLSDHGAQFRCIVSNSEGTATSSSATLAVLSGPPLSNLRSDEFTGTTLDARLWQPVNPLNDASFGIAGGVLAINVPAGISHDVWIDGNKAPRIMQSCHNTDFRVETKFSSPIGSQYQLEGLIVEEDAANFLRFSLHSDGTTIKALGIEFSSGTPSIRFDYSLGTNGVAPLHLRLIRERDVWTLAYSMNGTSWIMAGGFTHELRVTMVGVFAGNAGSNPAFNCTVDYFRNLDAVEVQGKAILQGPYVAIADTMRTDLAGVLPDFQPYGVGPWFYQGSETIGEVSGGIVDWVLIELCTSPDATTTVGSRAALIRRDGSVVDMNGQAVLFSGVVPGEYYIILRHRSHIDIMSAQPVQLSYVSPVYDFTVAGSQAYGTNPMVEVADGRFALPGGDVNASGVVTAADANAVYGALNKSGFEQTDANLSGIVTAADANLIFSNLNRSSEIP